MNPLIYTWTVEVEWVPNDQPEAVDRSTPVILASDTDEDVLFEAEAEFERIATRYASRSRRWGKRTWRVWEPGEGGFDCWIRIRRTDDGGGRYPEGERP